MRCNVVMRRHGHQFTRTMGGGEPMIIKTTGEILPALKIAKTG
jgi:hypothetical protein